MTNSNPNCANRRPVDLLHATRRLVLIVGSLCTAAFPAAAQPAAWAPTRPIKLVVPYAPGGGTDVLARIVTSSIGNSLGQPIVVENRPGVNGLLGANQVYAAPGDGTTLLFAAADFISVAPHIYKSAVKFDPNGYKPVALVAKMGFVLAAQDSNDAGNLSEVLAKLKTKESTYGHWGPGSMSQMGMELLKSSAGIAKILPVPYGGAAPMMMAVMAGDVDYAFIPTPLAIANRSKLKLYAVASPERFPALKNVPTLNEQGYAVDADTWFGVLAPPNTPQAAIDAIRAGIAKVINEPSVRARMAEMGYTPSAVEPAAFGGFVQAENARWGAVVKAANIKVDE